MDSNYYYTKGILYKKDCWFYQHYVVLCTTKLVITLIIIPHKQFYITYLDTSLTTKTAAVPFVKNNLNCILTYVLKKNFYYGHAAIRMW